jgi:hypothetical protein
LSKYYEKVKGYFDAGLWDMERARNAVEKEWITADEYEQITGKDYSAEMGA